MRITILPVAVMLLASSALAQTALEKVQNEPTRMICKKFEATGTRLGNRRVCATEEEWRQRAQADQGDINKIQASTIYCPLEDCVRFMGRK